MRMLDSAACQDLSACDNHAQQGDHAPGNSACGCCAAIRGRQRIRSAHPVSRGSLQTHPELCATRIHSFGSCCFGLENLHGLLNEHSFNLLAMSYETSPNEAWISVRRIVVAIPVVLFAPDPIAKILTEFQQLIRHGFFECRPLLFEGFRDNSFAAPKAN